jgi:Mrp family chromosome partitioning ATPase
MKTPVRSSPPTLADRLKEVAQYAEVKRMADHLLLLQRQKQFRSLAVLSLYPGEGKTLFTAMIAQAYAEAGHARVLVVDTTTLNTPRSLRLKQCMEPNHPLIDFLSLEEYRQSPNGNGHHSEQHVEAGASSESTVPPIAMLLKRNSDQHLIRRLSEERASQYDLILLDTAPLASKNKGNIDPLVMARISDASVLVMNPHRLDGSNLSVPVRMLKDPALHLIGIISNEEFSL